MESHARKEEHRRSRNFLSFWKFMRRFRRLHGTFQKGKLASRCEVVGKLFENLGHCGPACIKIKGRRQSREAEGAKFNLGSLPQIVEEQRNTFRLSAAEGSSKTNVFE
ncbi:hypothetical protein CEXT_416441 [Caerostris extrusa]|uniref:Uncharacterized protein n=1 Tax=Caerostris extrusa TaxID=172846 RepID=A0AAV4YA69_CAEEX|nr:hypothetical protein CEXT_416441 [Caerostris extrusa]